MSLPSTFFFFKLIPNVWIEGGIIKHANYMLDRFEMCKHCFLFLRPLNFVCAMLKKLKEMYFAANFHVVSLYKNVNKMFQGITLKIL